MRRVLRKQLTDFLHFAGWPFLISRAGRYGRWNAKEKGSDGAGEMKRETERGEIGPVIALRHGMQAYVIDVNTVQSHSLPKPVRKEHIVS